MDARLTDIEIQIAHLTRLTEELSTVVAGQSGEIRQLSRRVALLLQQAAEAEVLAGSAPLASQKPPHY